jgi:hypothetical protein
MATYTKMKFSGSTDGRGILITATATAGTLIHTAVSGTTSYDEIYLWASNTYTTDLLTTFEYGGAGAADQIILTIPAKCGLVHVIPKLILCNACVLRAFAGTASKINVFGFVNRIVP